MSRLSRFGYAIETLRQLRLILTAMMVGQAANMALCVQVTIGTESYFVSVADGVNFAGA